jgi:hypothetical protein
MDAVRFEISYLSPARKGLQRLTVRDHSRAAHTATRLVTDNRCWNVQVLRFDPDTGWDIVGWVKVYDRQRPGQAPTVVYQDGRTSPQRAADLALAERRIEAATDVVEPPRARSGMRMFGAAVTSRAHRARPAVSA